MDRDLTADFVFELAGAEFLTRLVDELFTLEDFVELEFLSRFELLLLLNERLLATLLNIDRVDRLAGIVYVGAVLSLSRFLIASLLAEPEELFILLLLILDPDPLERLLPLLLFPLEEFLSTPELLPVLLLLPVPDEDLLLSTPELLPVDLVLPTDDPFRVVFPVPLILLPEVELPDRIADLPVRIELPVVPLERIVVLSFAFKPERVLELPLLVRPEFLGPFR